MQYLCTMPKQIGSLTLYSVDDLHRQLGLSKMTIRTYLREGKIRGRKLGVKWYVSEKALHEYFDGGSPDKPKKNNSSQNYRYIVKGINDLVSEEEECDTIEETVDCIQEQAIISLFQVAVINQDSDEIVELVKARDFLDKHES